MTLVQLNVSYKRDFTLEIVCGRLKNVEFVFRFRIQKIVNHDFEVYNLRISNEYNIIRRRCEMSLEVCYRIFEMISKQLDDVVKQKTL